MADEQKTENKSKNVESLVEAISKLSVLELSQLVEALQEKFNITAQAPVVASAPVQSASAASEASAGAESQASSSATQTVILTNAGANKIAVIKALREINQNLGLKEAKDATENVPYEVLKDAKTEDAKSAAEKLKAAGATVEIK